MAIRVLPTTLATETLASWVAPMMMAIGATYATTLAWTVPPLAKSTALLALVLSVTAGAILLVKRWAGRNGDDVVTASDMLSKFREVHARGGLSDSEYRTIKTKLAPELQAVAAPMPPASDPSETRTENDPPDPPIDQDSA